MVTVDYIFFMKFKLYELQNPQELKFGGVNPWLAPLAGYSDLPFRLLCRELGAAVCETEMISAKGLYLKSPGTGIYLYNTPQDSPLVIQLFGNEAEILKSVVAALRCAGWLWFDINLGCPAKKVLRQGAGCSLLQSPELVVDIAGKVIKAATQINENTKFGNFKAKVGFKIRLGLMPEKNILPSLALRLQDLGAAWITLHPRYGSEKYTGHARWEELARLNELLDIPVIASGDLLSAQDGINCIKQTGVQTVMYARGAIRNPSIFTEHKNLLTKCRENNSEILNYLQNPQQLRAIVERHIDLTRQFCGDQKAFYKMRSIIPRYVRHFKGVGRLREALCKCQEWHQLYDALNEFIENADTEENL